MIRLVTILKRMVGLFAIVSTIIVVSSFALTHSNVVLAETNDPPSSIDVVVPDYEVTTVDGKDYVEIPDGMSTLEEGKPEVPYYTISIDYPNGYKVQDVTLANRSGLVTDTGLNIPTVRHVPGYLSTTGKSSEDEGEEWYPEEGWYPEKEYEWRTFGNLDGSTTLVIVMYPFYYNPQSTDVRFYKNYSFDIDYIVSSVGITSLTTERNVYLPGDTVTFDMRISNSGQAQDVVVNALVKAYGSDEIVDGLPLSTLDDLSGEASSSLQWISEGFEPGYYYIEVELKDTTGNTLDRKTEMFRLREYYGEISSFTATPQYFVIGDGVDISLAFQNTGKASISGTAIIYVESLDLGILEEFQHEFSDMAPSESVTFDDTWNTSVADEGTYYITGEVLYGDEAAGPMIVAVSSGPPPLTVTNVSPDHANQGDTLEITITGADFTGVPMVNLGSGINVYSLNLSSSTQITAGITIASDATTGARDVSVTIPEGKAILEDSFTVHEAGQAARVPWAIIAGVIGGVAVVGILLYLLRKRPRQRTEAE